MSDETSGSAVPGTRTRPGPIRQLVAGLFCLLALGFAFRLVQYGYAWISGAESNDLNYGALAIWSLVYVLVCTGIAATAWWMPADEATD